MRCAPRVSRRGRPMDPGAPRSLLPRLTGYARPPLRAQVPCIEMNTLELEFLFLINFSLFVPTDAYRVELHNHFARIMPSPRRRRR